MARKSGLLKRALQGRIGSPTTRAEQDPARNTPESVPARPAASTAQENGSRAVQDNDSIPAILTRAGFDDLAPGGSEVAIERVLRQLPLAADGCDSIRLQLLRGAAIKRLDSIGVRGAGKLVDLALRTRKVRQEGGPTDYRTYGDGIVDVVSLGDGELAWVVADEGQVFCEREWKGRSPWPAASLPWPCIPHWADVNAALHGSAKALFRKVTRALRERVVLPKPQEAWADLIAAWIFGTYRLDDFAYFPLLLTEGPPERGKTRLAKIILWLSFRGCHSPTVTPATLFRDRANHRATLGVDVEDLPKVLERGGDISDLFLNSFERDGVIRRTTHPEAPPPEQIETFYAYGPTILITNKSIPARSALASRCFSISMPEAGGAQLAEALSPSDAKPLRAELLAWAASTIASGVQLPPTDVQFRGRMGDAVTPLLRILALVSPASTERVVELLRTLESDRRDEVGTSWEARLGASLWPARESVIGGRLFYDDLLPLVNRGVSEHEDQYMNAQRIGYAIKELGLKKGKGGARGRRYLIWPGDEAAKQYHQRYAGEDPEKPANPSDPANPTGGDGATGLRILGKDTQLQARQTQPPAGLPGLTACRPSRDRTEDGEREVTSDDR